MTVPPTKEIVEELEAGGKGLVQFGLRVLGILDKLETHAKLIKAQAAQIEALRDAVHALQSREEVLLAKAEAAATLAASTAVADLARRIGHLEAELERRRT